MGKLLFDKLQMHMKYQRSAICLISLKSCQKILALFRFAADKGRNEIWLEEAYFGRHINIAATTEWILELDGRGVMVHFKNPKMSMRERGREIDACCDSLDKMEGKEMQQDKRGKGAW